MRGMPRRAASWLGGYETAPGAAAIDPSRLDHVSKTLADTRLQSRRGVIAALGAALVGTIMGIDPEAVDATPKRRRHPNHSKRHHPGQPGQQRVTTQQQHGKKHHGHRS